MASRDSAGTCYVICPIDEKGSPVRRRSDQLLKHVIRPAIKKFGYEVRRSDMDAEPGDIPAQIIRQMASAELVIADLTDFNPNVFYELAIRHVAAKPLVQLIQEGQEIPFDVGGMRTVYFNLADPDDLEDAKTQLRRHVEALQSTEEIETPVQASLRLKEALESPDPATAGSAEILAEIQAVRSDVERLRAGQQTTIREPGRRGRFPLTEWPESRIAGASIGKASPELERLVRQVAEGNLSKVEKKPEIDPQETRGKRSSKKPVTKRRASKKKKE